MKTTNMLGVRIKKLFASTGGTGIIAGVIDIDVTHVIESSFL